jgi:hypothetical protein
MVAQDSTLMLCPLLRSTEAKKDDSPLGVQDLGCLNSNNGLACILLYPLSPTSHHILGKMSVHRPFRLRSQKSGNGYTCRLLYASDGRACEADDLRDSMTATEIPVRPNVVYSLRTPSTCDVSKRSTAPKRIVA